MLIDFTDLSHSEAYLTMVKLVVPRPIGWVSTVDREGRLNLAPFSWFQTVCTAPPILMVAVGYRRGPDGSLILKDTCRNAEDTGECVIQLAERDQIEALVQTAANLEPEADEFAHAGLSPVASDRVAPPRVGGARVAFECRIEEVLVREGWYTRLIFARILCAQIDDALIGPDGAIKTEDWKPICRLGGNEYAEIGERFSIERPD